jgi:tryptophan synthase beta subunit
VKAFIEKNEDTLLDSNGRLYPDRLSHCPELQEHTDTHIFTKMKDLLRTGKHSTLEFFRTQYPALLFDQVERDLKSDYSHDIQNETLANEI